MTTKSKYDVSREWYEGFAAVLTGKSRSLGESDHWIAGWDAGYKVRGESHTLLNDYLASIGMKPMGVIRLQGESRP